MRKPLISVIVPIYNVELYLSRCIDSIINQTYWNLEIILVDDGSLDKCSEICDEYAKRDTRIKVIHKKHGGVSEARNAGMNIATGDYIAFVDSDDYITQNAYEILLQEATEHKLDVLVGNALMLNTNSKSATSYWANIDCKSIKTGVDFTCCIKMIPVPVWLQFVNLRFLRKTGIEFRKGYIHEDVLWAHELFFFAQRVKYLNFSFYQYNNKRDNSIMSTATKTRNIYILKICCDLLNLYKKVEVKKKRMLLNANISRRFLSAVGNSPVSEEPYRTFLKEKRFLLLKFPSMNIFIFFASLLFAINANLFVITFKIAKFFSKINIKIHIAEKNKKDLNRKIKIKVCIVAPVHIYSDIRVFQKEAKTLQQNGYQVRLLARHTEDAIIDGIEIKTVPRIKSKFLRFFSHPWILVQVLKYNPQIIHLHNPDTLIIGFILKLLGKKVVYDTHEDFEQIILRREWIPAILKKPLIKAIIFGEKLAGRFFDKVIVTQWCVLERIGNNCIVVENAPISMGHLVEKAYSETNDIIKEKCFRAIYIGGISELRGLFEMIKAVEYLNDIYKIESRLWLAGLIEEDLLKRAKKESGWQYVDYLGNLPQEKAFAYTIKSDVGFIIIKDQFGYRYANPNKIFEYQLFGIPFIASDFPGWRKNKEEETSQTGIFVNPIDTEAIAKAMYELATDKDKAKKIGQNGKKFIANHYNWEMESKKLLDLYDLFCPKGRF